MATLQLDITGGLRPDTSGDVFYQPASIIDSGTAFDYDILTFNDTATKLGAASSFVVPQNYVGTAQAIVKWFGSPTTGNVVWDLSYLNVADAEDVGGAAQDTTDTVTTTIDGTTFFLNTSIMTLTSGDFAPGDICQFEIFRDGTASDTLASTANLIKVIFGYNDA